jgi:CRISPR-associated endonuclease/helicase Cas3
MSLLPPLTKSLVPTLAPPLTLPLRHGNIPAGAVAGSFLVFDEVHLFDPELALQAVLANL